MLRQTEHAVLEDVNLHYIDLRIGNFKFTQPSLKIQKLTKHIVEMLLLLACLAKRLLR